MKVEKTVFSLILAIIMLTVIAFPVFAQAGPPESPAEGVIATVLDALPVGQLLTLLGLILLQVILGVALAIRNKKFEWQKLGDFYQTKVIPYVIGWLAFVFVVRLISTDLLGPAYSGLVGDGVTWVSWLVVVSSLGARIVDTAKDLYGSLLPFKMPPDPADFYNG
ncbi:MAG TPA: hypothetical protein VN364_08185 [Bellilinea sp.]|nr:hypothetical protein [Bellilinea sp.]